MNLPQPGTPEFERMISEQTARNKRNRISESELERAEKAAKASEVEWCGTTFGEPPPIVEWMRYAAYGPSPVEAAATNFTFEHRHQRPAPHKAVIETTARRVDAGQPESEFREYMAALPSPQDVARSFGIPAHIAGETQ